MECYLVGFLIGAAATSLFDGDMKGGSVLVEDVNQNKELIDADGRVIEQDENINSLRPQEQQQEQLDSEGKQEQPPAPQANNKVHKFSVECSEIRVHVKDGIATIRPGDPEECKVNETE